MTGFLALAERQWHGELELVHADHPVGAGHPGAQEIAPGLLHFEGVAAISVVDTGAGLVMFDAGTKRDIDRVYETLLARVGQREAEGDLRRASHLVEMVMLASLDASADGSPDPEDRTAETDDARASDTVFEARARVYAARSATQRSTMGRGIFNHFAVSSRERRRDRLTDLTDAPAARPHTENEE